MVVEWLGGPDDGKLIEVSDGTRFVTIARPVLRPWADPARGVMEPTVDMVSVPVQRTYYGKLVLVWPKSV